uniref:NADH-ubiquinone oxidoreductase chain 2 n=1 Tax=Pygovepres vaccinicola TaxID=981301 RepID=A0A514LPF3_9HEMI|nr:NADH dehydrogenase subunit 2 [Pygovepres vaccinicola]QDI93505.1 NADH dehydrogenase subunit 2 [Pygovepres vaccinicola]
MKTSSKTLFFCMMIMSTLMVMNSSSWISMWAGLEINLMSFVPLISTTKNTFNSQSVMMYFLIQSMASMMFIMFILTNKYMFIYLNNDLIKTLILISMMIKMGMPPFHFWFPEMMNKMKWTMCMLLMTWQKIAPMYIMSMVISLNSVSILVICLSAITGAMGGINHTSTRKMLAYSSINHMSWMISCTAMFKKSWIIYMAIYSLMMFLTSMMMYEYNIMFINQMNFFLKNKMDKMIIIFLMMSIGGLPPFLGFIPKWIAIQYMISTNEFIMLTIMAISSLITLSYYLRLSSTMNMSMSHSQKWMYMFKTNKKTSTYIFSMNMMLPMSILLMNFY